MERARFKEAAEMVNIKENAITLLVESVAWSKLDNMDALKSKKKYEQYFVIYLCNKLIMLIVIPIYLLYIKICITLYII